MRKTITLILSIMIAAQFLCGQTLYKTHYNLMDDVYCIEQANDGGYFISGGYLTTLGGFDSLVLCKFDSKGKLQWRNAFRSPHIRSERKNIEILRDGSVILTGTSESLFTVRKFNQGGDLIWFREIFSNENTPISAGVEQTADGNIITTAVIHGKNFGVLNILSPDGNIHRTKNFSISISSFDRIKFIEINSNLYLLATDKGLYAFSSSGDLLWQKLNLEYRINTVFPNSVGNIVAVGKLIHILNTSGEIQSELPLTSDEIFAGIAKNNSYYFLKRTPIKLLITDELGNEIKEILFDHSSAVINVSYDNKLLLAANDFQYLLLLKLNEDDKLLDITFPNGGDKLLYNSWAQIKWNSFNLDSVNIDISFNGGSDWKNLATNYQNFINSFGYNVPLMFSDKCLLKVSDSSDPGFYDTSDSLFSILTYQEQDYIEANRVKMWMANNGMSAHNPYSNDSGFYWPGGENAAPWSTASIFSDGFLIGGKINGEVRVHGASYRYGLMPGSINEDGTPSDPFNTAHQLFKIKKEVPDNSSDVEKLKYKLMYENWPAEKGAPWWDVNGDEKFTRNVDKPAMIGDEVLFFVANDLDSNRTKSLYGSPPVGLEFQTTVFASDDPVVEDAVFKKVKIINKSGKIFEDVYISYWTDDDLGNAGDDYVGCDTSLSLGYTYNGDNDDEGYYGTPPPAVGHLLIQGPKVPGISGDSAFFNNNWISGYKNLKMTAYTFFNKSQTYPDAALGKYEGSLQTYDQMQGNLWNGDPVIDPITGNQSKYFLYGDPVGGTGWYDGPGWPGYAPWPGDRRYLMSSGPFTMAPGDSQEVVFAIYMAKGTDNLNSITKLKEKASDLIDYYFNEIPKLNNQNQNLFPNEFSISNNYPNPFNASTTIELNLPVIEGTGKTSLRTVVKVYDILGREVKTLLNRELLPGPHKIQFNGNGLASGVYILRFEAEGRFQTIKKLMLLK